MFCLWSTKARLVRYFDASGSAHCQRAVSLVRLAAGKEAVETVVFPSVPRSGSTWMRRLLEFSTGVATDTVFDSEVPKQDYRGHAMNETLDQSWYRLRMGSYGSCEHMVLDGGRRNNSGSCSTDPP